MPASVGPSPSGIVVQIASYNTNLQGNLGVPQDLVDWLSPTLTVSKFLSRQPTPPDIVAVGFQELLPLYFGLSGFSKSVIQRRDELIRSQIEIHAPNKDRYSLVAKEVFVGVALLVYARDEGIASRICDIHTSWTGCGPAWMGNKGAVGVRFRVRAEDGGVGEVFTFVNAHLTAHQHNLSSRIANYNYIVQTLLFPSPSGGRASSTLYATSHLFFLGDLNFRLDIPEAHPLVSGATLDPLYKSLDTEQGREELKEYDQLLVERRKGTVFAGLREAEFWRFKCTYKFRIGEVDKYDPRRVPSWTDRILYATYLDSSESPAIIPILYTSVPSYTTSDHKPIVASFLIPSSTPSQQTSAPSIATTSIPLLPHSATYNPDRYAALKRHTGRIIGYILGLIWCLLWMLGLGNVVFGVVNIMCGFGAVTWWRNRTVDTV